MVVQLELLDIRQHTICQYHMVCAISASTKPDCIVGQHCAPYTTQFSVDIGYRASALLHSVRKACQRQTWCAQRLPVLSECHLQILPILKIQGGGWNLVHHHRHAPVFAIATMTCDFLHGIVAPQGHRVWTSKVDQNWVSAVHAGVALQANVSKMISLVETILPFWTRTATTRCEAPLLLRARQAVSYFIQMRLMSVQWRMSFCMSNPETV